MQNRRHFGKIAVAAAALLVASDFAAAQVDTVVSVVGKDFTVGGVIDPISGLPVNAPLGAFGYVPAIGSNPEKFYAVGFNNSAQDIREINPSGSSFTFTRLVTNSPYLMYTRTGHTNYGGGTPTPGSLLLNPVATGSLAAYSTAIITDGGGVVTNGGTALPAESFKLYRYNLAQDTNADAREEMTTLVTIQNMKDALGLPSTASNSTNVSRQVAYSTDASKVYFVDISSVYGGLWVVNTEGGGLARLDGDTTMSAEPAVRSVGGHDRIFVNGTTATGNAGGISYYDTADNTRKILISGADVAAFMETTTADISITAMSTDAEGNLYFNNTDSSPERRGLYKLDTSGRLIKVIAMAERQAVLSSTNSNIFRQQPRTISYTGPGGTFDITQILYYEPSSINAIGGINVFKPGDFNRDNAFTAADGLAFAQKLTPMATTTLVAAVDAKYDLNGNNLVNYKDVRVLQPFIGFKDGDSNLDLSVNFDDLLALAQNYDVATGMTWYKGDFNGDDAVNFADLLVLAQNYDSAPASLDALDSAFAADWALAQSLVPEPTSVALVLGAALLPTRRRRA